MKFTLNFEEEAAFLSAHTNCTFEEALCYVQTEDDYYDTLGLNSYPGKNGLFEVNGKKYTSSDFNSLAEKSKSRGTTYVDISRMNEFISAKTSLSLEKCTELATAESDYFVQIGIAVPV